MAGARGAGTPLPPRHDGEGYAARHTAETTHAGGRWRVEYARGRDVSFLFKSIHSLNEEKARNALLKLPKIAEPRDAAPYGFALGEEPAEVENELQQRRPRGEGRDNRPPRRPAAPAQNAN